MADINKELEKRRSEGNFRILKTSHAAVDFCSNDYLGQANSPSLKTKILKRLEAENLKQGAGAARLIGGNSAELEQLEAKLAEFHNAESALVFSTGYLSNLALFSSLPKKGDTVFYDELSHASSKDGIRLSPAESYSFKHNDLADLEKKSALAKGNVYLSVESMYSMDGDYAPLEELVAFAEKKGFFLIVDEAHTNGIYGKLGEGRVSELNLEKKVFARNLTFGKAVGVQGGAIIGPKNLREYIINFSRPFIYSTAISPFLVAMIDEAYKELPKLEAQRRQLFDNVKLFNQEVRREVKTHGPIQIVQVPGNVEAKAKATAMQEQGYDVRAVLSPTVQKGKERLRICLHSFNSEDEIAQLARILND